MGKGEEAYGEEKRAGVRGEARGGEK